MQVSSCLVAIVYVAIATVALGCAGSDIGAFTGSTDIGDVGRQGSTTFDRSTGSYRVRGGGANMWFNTDAAHVAWTRVSGDTSIAADIEWVGDGVDPHRKAGVIVRESLEADAAYADVVVHGDGLTSLQYRELKGGQTREIQSNVAMPRGVRLERQGNYVFMSASNSEGEFSPAGGSFRLELPDPYYLGLVVCAHNNHALEEARFSNVVITQGTTRPDPEPRLESTLETINVGSTDRRVVMHTTDHIEAPNWSRDGTYLLYNSNGLLYTIPVEGGAPKHLDTGTARRNNNDHGISPDGTKLVISDQSHEDGQSRIHVLPITGGIPTLVTPTGPSYWHGWSPDGSTLAFVGLRDGDYDIYTVPVDGGPETRLTTAEGLDDGPDYSPDGQFIYFNSVRTGTMQIWRMKADGSDEVQLTFDEYNDWFPHPSPDGKWLVFVSYEQDVEGHPPNQDVMLRMMPVDGGEITVLTKLFGGQGTINVPSWSPDSRNVAFVSYRLVHGD